MPNFRAEIAVIERILDEAIINQKPHFLIKWKYLPHENNSWEPIENLRGFSDLIREWKVRNRFKKEEPELIKKQMRQICDNVYSSRTKRHSQLKGRKRIKGSCPQIDLDADEKLEAAQTQGQCFNRTEQLEGGQKKLEQGLVKKEKLKKEAMDTEAEPKSNKELPKSPRVESSMKVIGTVVPENINQILSHFVWKETACLKIQLQDGKVTNMRETDLRSLCPSMLAEYYEEKGIEF